MAEEAGMPKLGAGAVLLGIRRGKDIDVDAAGNVHRPTFQLGGKNGLSCAATIASLPPFSLPVEWGGSNTRTVVWEIVEEDVPPRLVVGVDSKPPQNRHLSIGPSTTMGYDDFEAAIEATRTLWRKVTKT
jgi:hypothetical protein